MVDPNPARGMPLPLQRYWLTGKGALKIRWGMPHDFNRCVRQLRKYFPTNPEGLCNILHTKALGAPPGKGHPGEASLSTWGNDPVALVSAQALLDQQPQLGAELWAGPIAPIGRPTGEPRRQRMFEHGALSHRSLPLPLAHRRVTAEGHQGAVTVGRVLGITYGPDHTGQDYAWGWGDWLDPELVPEVKEAKYLVGQGVVGTSVDPGGRIVVAVNPETGIEHMSQYTIAGVTLVPIAAFTGMRIRSFPNDEEYDWDDDDMVMELEEDCGCGAPGALVAAVNNSGWKGLPLAPRDAVFDNDDAVKRIAAWAQVNAQGADVEKLKRAFMWHDPRMPETATTSYRLPFGDVINGRLTLIYHAIYAAAALLSGAHGGLPDIPEQDKAELRQVISDIYPEMAEAFNDPTIRAPWDRSAQEGVQLAMTETFAATEEPYGDVKYADPGYRDNKKRYPIDTPEHIRAAWAYINVPKNAEEYDEEQLGLIKGRIQAAAKKAGIQISDAAMKMAPNDAYAMTDEGYPLTPPKAWFEDPQLTEKTPLTVDEDGRVYGHLAAWGECHRDIAMRECVLAPRSRLGYAPFHLGNVLTAEGETVRVGKIVMDTRHADLRLGYAATAIHYDNTGDEIAVIRAGEDEFGIWVAGSVVPEATPKKVAKLRRSPLSGDWRREQGSLELTAALAVNAPAFPVYAMENEEQMALVAAGTVMFEYNGPPTGIDMSMVASAVREVLDDREAREARSQRLADLLEDEEIYKQRDRAARLAGIFAMDPAAPPAPATADESQDWETWLTAAEGDAKYDLVQEGSPLEPGSQAQQPVEQPVVQQPVGQPVQQPVA